MHNATRLTRKLYLKYKWFLTHPHSSSSQSLLRNIKDISIVQTIGSLNFVKRSSTVKENAFLWLLVVSMQRLRSCGSTVRRHWCTFTNRDFHGRNWPLMLLPAEQLQLKDYAQNFSPPLSSCYSSIRGVANQNRRGVSHAFDSEWKSPNALRKESTGHTLVMQIRNFSLRNFLCYQQLKVVSL